MTPATMPTTTPKGQVIEGAFTRRCERAVVTAYRELRQVGSNDLSAFQACTALYRIHHPEASMNEARRLVAEWIDQHLHDAAPALEGQN